MRAFSIAALLLIASLLLSACASTEPTPSEQQRAPSEWPPSGPTLADDIWWNGLEGEKVYEWTSAQTMPQPVGGMPAVVESVRRRIGGLDCVENHASIFIEVLVSAEGDLIDTRIPRDAENDACENLTRLAAFDLEWEPGTIDGEPVHATVAYGFPTEFLYE
ncbi:MAG: hypothetical protein GVY12_08895 [Bacteroidetes bacterium]|jgi:hypothetical protein|nr:hypothetical protein [Bacteroidota bacterium]